MPNQHVINELERFEVAWARGEARVHFAGGSVTVTLSFFLGGGYGKRRLGAG